MRTLIGWDDSEQAELISLFLNNDENEAVVCTEASSLLDAARAGGEWDAILLALKWEEFDSSFDVFKSLHRELPECPIIGACESQDVFRIARFMTNGMWSYLIRDAAADFIFMLRSTIETTVEAVHAERERIVAARLREEVESVRKLQQSIIPDDLTSPAGYQVCARYESSQIRVLGGVPVVLAGGDYYDAFMLDDDSMVLLLGDASGHGMKACMSIMTMHTLIRMMRNEDYRDTASFVANVNRRLCQQEIVNDEGGFITLMFGVLQADRHEFQWSSAGHPLPLLHDLKENTIRQVGDPEDGGLPLAILPEAEYEINTIQIPPHSRLLLYTDGLEEAFPDDNGQHIEFGREGVERTMLACQKKSVDETLATLFDASHAFTGGKGRHDDTSVVLLERE